jgi:hypothetical protein
MRSPVDADILTGTRSDRSSAVPARRGPHDPRDPWLRIGPDGGMTLPLPGQSGHGRTASLRRQPVRIVDGRMEGAYMGTFELICPSCGDHPYLDYSEIPPRLQRIRGPYPLQAGLAAYEAHIGLVPGPDEASPARSGAGDAEEATTR